MPSIGTNFRDFTIRRAVLDRSRPLDKAASGRAPGFARWRVCGGVARRLRWLRLASAASVLVAVGACTASGGSSAPSSDTGYRGVGYFVQ